MESELVNFSGMVSNAISSNIPSFWQPLISLTFYAVILVIYIIFIWKFYRFLANKDVLDLDLERYNRSEHPLWYKFQASFLFLLEYIIILPVLVFFWFGVLAIFLLFLSKSQSVVLILKISAAIVAATRIASYYSEGAARELAKIFPLTILATSLSDPNFFSIEKWVSRFSQLPSLFNHLLIYLIFIAAIEIILRSFYLFIDFITSEEEREVVENTG